MNRIGGVLAQRKTVLVGECLHFFSRENARKGKRIAYDETVIKSIFYVFVAMVVVSAQLRIPNIDDRNSVYYLH